MGGHEILENALSYLARLWGRFEFYGLRDAAVIRLVEFSRNTVRSRKRPGGAPSFISRARGFPRCTIPAYAASFQVEHDRAFPARHKVALVIIERRDHREQQRAGEARVFPRLERVAPGLALPRVEIKWTERELESLAALSSANDVSFPTEALIRALRD